MIIYATVSLKHGEVIDTQETIKMLRRMQGDYKKKCNNSLSPFDAHTMRIIDNCGHSHKVSVSGVLAQLNSWAGREHTKELVVIAKPDGLTFDRTEAEKKRA